MMLERLELNNRDPRRRELYVRHHQIYTLLELNVVLTKLTADRRAETKNALQELSLLIADVVGRFEEAADPDRLPRYYSDSQISKLHAETHSLQKLAQAPQSIAELMEAARSVIAAGSIAQYAPPRLVYSSE